MRERRVLLLFSAALLLASLPIGGRGAAPQGIDRRLQFSGSYSQTLRLTAGDPVEISVGIESPSKLPDNGRLAVEWSAPKPDAGFRKVLHALDPDVFML